MNQTELRQEWIRRLRSGEYEQGKGCLNRFDRYCCLGVLCELLSEQGLVEKHKCPRDSAVYYRHGGFGSQTQLPGTSNELIGLVRPDGGTTVPLTILNDDMGWTFDQIADVLEKGEFWETEEKGEPA